jgi:hypothetical protein
MSKRMHGYGVDADWLYSMLFSYSDFQFKLLIYSSIRPQIWWLLNIYVCSEYLTQQYNWHISILIVRTYTYMLNDLLHYEPNYSLLLFKLQKFKFYSNPKF